MQRCRVREEGFRIVNLCLQGRKKTVPEEEAPANYVPAAAVIRRERALSGITGCKGSVGGVSSRMLNLPAQLIVAFKTATLECSRGRRNS